MQNIQAEAPIWGLTELLVEGDKFKYKSHPETLLLAVEVDRDTNIVYFAEAYPKVKPTFDPDQEMECIIQYFPRDGIYNKNLLLVERAVEEIVA